MPPSRPAPSFPLARGILTSGILLGALFLAYWAAGWRVRVSLPAWSDLHSYFLPKYQYAADRIAAGDLPVWNPLEFGGIPFLATIQPAVLYPPLRLAFGLFRGESALLALFWLHVTVGAIGALAFARDLGARLWPAVFAAAWVTEPLMLAWSYDHPPFLAATAWIPWLLLLARRSMVEPDVRAAAGLGAVAAMVALCGYPFFALASAYVVAPWMVAWAVEVRPDSAGVRRRALLLTLAGGIALLLAAAQLLPTAELASASSRLSDVGEGLGVLESTSASRGPGFLSGFGLPEATFSDQARAAASRFGPFLLGPALLLPLLRPRWPSTWALLAVFVLCALLPFRAYHELPLYSVVRFFAEWAFLASFVTYLLAALGLDALFRGRFPGRALPAVTLALLAFATAWNARRIDPQWLESSVAASVRLPEDAEAACQIRDPRYRAYWPAGQISGALLTERIRSVVGFEQSLMPARTAELSRMVDIGNGAVPGHWPKKIVRSRNLLSRLGLRCLIAARSRDLERGGFELVGGEPPGQLVYRNPDALPRARVVYDVREVETAEEALEVLRVGEEQRTVLERAAPTESTCRPDAEPSVRWIRDESEDVVVETRTDCPALLVLADTLLPGWTATVNGEPRPILPADYAFRAVEVPAGTSEVAFHYAPTSVRVGLGLSALGLLLLAVLLLRRRPGGLP